MKFFKRTLTLFLVILMAFGAELALTAETDFFDGFFVVKSSAASMKQKISSMSVGDKISYGSYPQTDVTDSMGDVLTNAAPSTSSWKSYNYYVNGTQSDYMKYYDLSYDGNRYRGVYFSKYRPYYSDYSSSSSYTRQVDNGYTTSKIYWFRYEPLTWRILDPKTGYVLCENIIDSQAFNNEYYSHGKDAYGSTAYYSDKTYTHLANNWEYSTIRKWLNETFYTTAFSSSERSQIPCTKHSTPAFSTSYSAFDVGETGDYVFLPTYQDMINTSYGFSSNDSNYDINRRAHSSDYAKSQGVCVVSEFQTAKGEDASHYRLRSAGADSYCTTGVDGYGDVKHYKISNFTGSGIRPALCFNPSSIGNYEGSSKYGNEVTFTVSGYNNSSLNSIGSDKPILEDKDYLKNFTLTTSTGSKTVENESSVKINIDEAKQSDVKISKSGYRDYIIPAAVFDDIFNEGFSANIDAKLPLDSKENTGYISTAFAKENDDYHSYKDTVISSLNISNGGNYKVILKAGGAGSNVTYRITQDGGHKLSNTTGVFEGNLFKNFTTHKDIYAYITSSKGTSPLTKLKLTVISDTSRKKLDSILNSTETSLLGDSLLSVKSKSDNDFLEGLSFDFSSFNVPVSFTYDSESDTIMGSVGFDFDWEKETKASSTTGTKWTNDGKYQFKSFVDDFKDLQKGIDKNGVFGNVVDGSKKQYSKAMEPYNKAKQMKEKYGKSSYFTKKQSKDWNLEIMGFIEMEVVWSTDKNGNEKFNLVYKDGGAVVTGKFEYEYCQNGFAGPVPGYMYFGWGVELSVKASAGRAVADSSVPVEFELTVGMAPELKAGAGVGWKNLASLGLYGEASVPMSLKPAFANKSGHFTLDVKGEIGIEATALFVFKSKTKIVDGTLNVVDKYWSKNNGTKTLPKYYSNSLISNNLIVEPETVSQVESTDRSYAAETSAWLGTKTAPLFKAMPKAKALDLSGLKFTTLQESVFYAPQTQLALVGDKVLMVYVEDDTARTANNRMRLMYTVYDPSADSWSQPEPVSDNGRNDAYPNIVSDGKNCYVAWIKSNTLYPDDLSNSVDVLKACEVYLSKFDNENETFINATRITDDSVYDYCPSVAIDVNGNPVVYYASCTDNNTYGNNNTITKYNGTKSVIASGKYYILSMTANSNATDLTYIMDENGDTSDSSGVNAYTVSGGTTSPLSRETAIADVFYAKLDGKERLFFSDRTNIYYKNDNGEEIAVLGENTGIASAIYPVETDDGLTLLFTKKSADVSELFSVSQTDDGWTTPIQISSEGKLIENVAVASKSGKLYGCLTTSEDGKTDLVGFSFSDFTDISLGSISVSEMEINAGEDSVFTIAVLNNGTKNIESVDFTVSDTLGTNSEQTVDVDIKPGELKNVELKYHAPENYTSTTLTVSADVLYDKNTDDNISTKLIGLPDIVLDEPVVEEKTDSYVITTYAENLSDVSAKNVSVSVKSSEKEITSPAVFAELALLQREEICLSVPKSSLKFDEDGIAKVTFKAVSDSTDANETTNEVIAVLTDNSKDETGKCTHIETELKETPATCISKGKVESVCASCGEVLATVAVLDETTHSYKNVVVKATCTKDGTVTSACSLCGAEESSTVINKASNVKLSKTSYTYNGKVQKPKLTVKDSNGNDISTKYYTAKWSNASSKSVGTYTVKITFKGNYSGTKTLKYKILPKQVTGLKASTVKTTSIKLTWSKVTGAKYYKVEKSTNGKKWSTVTTTGKNSYTVSKLKAGTKYQYRVTALDSTKKIAGKSSAVLKTQTLCSAPSIKLTSTKSKTATVSWSKVTGATGYVVAYSKDNKNWTKKTVTGTSYTIKSLTGGKKVYVKVQAKNSYKLNSKYSTVKSVTVKK